MNVESGRWSLLLGESTTTDTSDRLGDSSAARYRRLRRFVEALDVEDERLDHALLGLLLSAESLRDEMQAYEQQTSVLLRLAQTGHFVRQLQRLNRVVDSVAAAFGMEEPTAASNWGKKMEEERAERMERYDRLLEDVRCDCKSSGDGRDKTEERSSLLLELETEEKQQEVLMLLKFAMDTYGDVLTPREAEATADAFRLVVQRFNVVVMVLPSWFAAPFEFGATFGLSRWGNDLFEPGHEDQTRVIKLANVWSRLNHPHVAKFLGACHVGDRVFIAHEKLRPLQGYVADLVEEKRSLAEAKQKVWYRMYEVALSLQYLHERGLAYERLDVDAVFCAQFEDKAVLLGVGLIDIGRPSSLDGDGDQEAQHVDVTPDVQALGAVILSVLKMLSPPVDPSESNAFLDALESRTSSADPGKFGVFHQQIAKKLQSEEACRFDLVPAVRPEFVSLEEWAVLKLIRDVRATSSGELLQVLIAMQEIVGLRQDQPNHSRIVDQAFEATSGTIAIGQLLLPTLGNKTVSSVLAQLKDLFASNHLALDVYARLEDVCTQLKSLIELKGISEGSLKAAVADFLSLLVRTHQLSHNKAGRDSAGSSRFASYLSSVSGSITPSQDPSAVLSLHANIDHLLRQHDLDDSSAVHHWKPSCNAIILAHQVAYREDLVHLWSAIGQPDGRIDFIGSQLDADAQDEVEALLAFELGHRLDSLGSAPLNLQRALQSKLPRWFLPRSEVMFKFEAGELGRGSFGAVLFGKWFDTPVVVKRVFIDADNRQRVRDQFRREADVWFPLNHINVVKLYGACHVGDPFFICEYASGGNLDVYLRREGREPYRMWYCLLNAALGLQYLHDSGIVHGDLKANNILVGTDNVVKLADFGLSTSTRDGQDSGSGGALGAYRWKAPECLVGESATFTSDVFSFAMVMVEIMTGVIPWGGMDDQVVKALVVRGDTLKKPAEIDDPEWQLIQRMCCRDPTKRVTIDAVVVHLSSLIESLAMPQLWPSIHGDMALKSFQNHVGSRGGALLSLLTLASSRNKKLKKLSADRLRAVHIGRDTPSDKREIDAIINILFTGSDVEREWAAGALTTLTWENSMNKLRVAAGGAIPLLVALLRDGSDVHKEKAASALTNMALGADNQVEIAAAGAIELLIALVSDGTDGQKEMSAGALANLATNQESKMRIAMSGVLDALVALARDGTEGQKVKTATAFWNLARNSEANAELIAAAGAIPPLVEMVRSRTKAQSQRAAGALKNLAEESEKNRVAVAEAGGLGPLVTLARDGSSQEKDQAVGALWSLSTNNRENQATIIAIGGVSVLVALTRDGTNVQKEKAAGALAMLAENADGKVRIVEADGITPLVALVREGIDDEQEIAANALGNLSLSPETSALIAATGAIVPLVLLAREGTVSQKIAATSALWCLSVYSADNRTAIVAAGGVVELVALVRSGHDFNKYLAAGALGTLAADNKPIQALIAAEGGIDALVELVRSGSDGEKQQAASALRHLSKDNVENQAQIEAAGGISPLVAMMRDATPVQKEVAFEIVVSLTESTNNPAAITKAGGVAPLVVLVRSGTRAQQDRAATALVTLSSSMDLTESVVVARELAVFAHGGTFQQQWVVLRTLLMLLPRVLALWWRRWQSGSG
jgi:serine/threonine protein kinase